MWLPRLPRAWRRRGSFPCFFQTLRNQFGKLCCWKNTIFTSQSIFEFLLKYSGKYFVKFTFSHSDSVHIPSIFDGLGNSSKSWKTDKKQGEMFSSRKLGSLVAPSNFEKLTIYVDSPDLQDSTVLVRAKRTQSLPLKFSATGLERTSKRSQSLLLREMKKKQPQLLTIAQRAPTALCLCYKSYEWKRSTIYYTQSPSGNIMT